MNSIKVVFSALLALGLTACVANQEQYYWGQYESMVYKHHNLPAEATADVQIAQLVADIEYAKAHGKIVAPGIYAHLGYMYAAQGQMDLAIQALHREKELFPDSATFIDGLIARANRNKER